MLKFYCIFIAFLCIDSAWHSMGFFEILSIDHSLILVDPKKLFPIHFIFISCREVISQGTIVMWLRDLAFLFYFYFTLEGENQISKSVSLSLCPVYMNTSQIH